MSAPAPYDAAGGQPSYGFPPPGPANQPVGYGYGPGSGFGYGRPPARNGLSITSMVLGILALALCWLTLPGVILGVIAVIFGGIALARAKSDRVSNKGMAIAGVVTGVLGAVIGIVLLIFALGITTDCQQQYGSQITEDQLTSCVQDQIGN